eukprot:scpid106184/ scgid6669/ 
MCEVVSSYFRSVLFTVNEVAMTLDVHVCCSHMQMCMWMRVLCVVCMGGCACKCVCLCCSVLFMLRELALTLDGQQWPVLAEDKLLEGKPEPPESPQLVLLKEVSV